MDAPASPNEPRTATSHAAYRLLGIYLAVVLSLTLVGTALIRSAAEADAPIGGALLLGVAVLLGMPWSLAVFMANDGLDGDVASAAMYAALAILNAVLLLWLGRVISRRTKT